MESGSALDVEMPDRETRILADPVSLEVALCDLVRRTRENARSGRGVRVLVRVEPRQDTVVIRVSTGDGAGVAAPLLSAGRNDLRLLVVRRLVAQMEGTLEIEGRDCVVTLRRVRGAE
jgi:hypothetical protein